VQGQAKAPKTATASRTGAAKRVSGTDKGSPKEVSPRAMLQRCLEDVASVRANGPSGAKRRKMAADELSTLRLAIQEGEAAGLEASELTAARQALEAEETKAECAEAAIIADLDLLRTSIVEGEAAGVDNGLVKKAKRTLARAARKAGPDLSDRNVEASIESGGEADSLASLLVATIEKEEGPGCGDPAAGDADAAPAYALADDAAGSVADGAESTDDCGAAAHAARRLHASLLHALPRRGDSHQVQALLRRACDASRLPLLPYARGSSSARRWIARWAAGTRPTSRSSAARGGSPPPPARRRLCATPKPDLVVLPVIGMPLWTPAGILTQALKDNVRT